MPMFRGSFGNRITLRRTLTAFACFSLQLDAGLLLCWRRRTQRQLLPTTAFNFSDSSMEIDRHTPPNGSRTQILSKFQISSPKDAADRLRLAHLLLPQFARFFLFFNVSNNAKTFHLVPCAATATFFPVITHPMSDYSGFRELKTRRKKVVQGSTCCSCQLWRVLCDKETE